MSVTKESISTVIGGILDTAAQDNVDAYTALASNNTVKSAVEYAREGLYEEFSLELLHPFDSVVDGLLASITDSSEAQFLIKHSDFAESHFNRLIEKFEGSPCCSDKSRTIVSSLIRYYIDDVKINFNYEQEVTYHLPKKIFKTHDQIVAFAKGLHHLFYGRPDFYLEALQAVVTTADNEKC